MRPVLIPCAILLAAACGSPQGATPAPRGSRAAVDRQPLDDLAREIDPGPQAPLWPQMPQEVRARVEFDAPRDKAPEARLAAARERLGQWSLQLSTTDMGAIAPQLDRAFLGVYLAEPLALSKETNATSLEARALLWGFYSTFVGTAPMLRTFESTWGGAPRAGFASSMAAAELLASAGPKMNDRFAADILRARAPDQAVLDISWQQASRKLALGDAEGGRAIYAEFVRRSRASASIDDQLRIAEAYIRLEDPRAAAAAVLRAKSSVSADDRSAEARVRFVDRERQTLVRLLALPSDAAPATALARFDLLLELDRGKEAESVLAKLVKERPKDARVRARSVRLRVKNGDITEHLVDELRGEDLTDRNGEYWSMRIGAAGIAISKSAPSPAMLNEVSAAGAELAKSEPGRAAALSFVVERVTRLLGRQPDAASAVAALRASFEDVVALRAKFPDTTDVDRLAIALALFAQDPSKGLAVVLMRPKVAPADDAELYSQRAQTAVTLAAYVGNAADLAAVRRAVEDIPPSSDASAEAAREALLGDVEVLSAVAQRDRTAWARAALRYEAAKKTAKNDRARLDNNLGFIAAQGGDAARATALFESAGRAKSGRVWVPVLNLATLPKMSKDAQLAAVRAMSGAPGTELPALVNAWRASLEPEAREAGVAATNALADLDAALSFHKVALHTMGLETEGTFGLGLGLRSGALAHTFSASAYATLWLVRPMPLTRAELEAKAAAAKLLQR